MIDFKYHDFLRPKENFCPLPFTKVILSSWGEVSMCCHQTQQIGKLTETNTILEIWQNAVAQEIRNSTINGELHKVCLSAQSCPFITTEKTPYQFSSYEDYRYPTHLEVCLPDSHCNIGGTNPNDENPACIMCKRNFDGATQPDIRDFLYFKSKPIMPYLQKFTLLGIAEPFWKNAVFDAFEKLNFEKYKHQIKFSTNTNGTCFSESIINNLFQKTCTTDISWSLDAATPTTFEKIRRIPAFHAIIKNLRNYLNIRDNYGGKEKHVVSIWNNINMLNVHEMPDMVRQGINYGVDYMIMIPTYEQGGVVKLGDLFLNNKNVKLFKKASEEAMQIANDNNFWLGYPTKFDVPQRFDEELVQIK